jgi:hypothetical protein
LHSCPPTFVERLICGRGGNLCPILDSFKKLREGGRGFAPAGLGDLSQVIGEFGFFDDEKMFPVCLNQSKVAKSLDKKADPRGGTFGFNRFWVIGFCLILNGFEKN